MKTLLDLYSGERHPTDGNADLAKKEAPEHDAYQHPIQTEIIAFVKNSVLH